jgi:hypothetical protein
VPLPAAGGFAGGDVGPIHDNKRHHDEIELTTVRLVVVARVELAPATARGGDRRRRSGGLGVVRRGDQLGANKRAGELAWMLRSLAVCLDGGERGPGGLSPAAADWRRRWRGRLGAAREERPGGFIPGSGGPWVTRW